MLDSRSPRSLISPSFEQLHRPLYDVLGGPALLKMAFQQFSHRWEQGYPVSIIQVRNGELDWTPVLSQWAQFHSQKISLSTIDIHDVRFPLEKVDYVFSVMALHRFSEEQAVAFLKKINLMSKRGFVVIDGLRDGRRSLATHLLSPLFCRGLHRQQEMQSLACYFSAPEISRLVEKAGLDLIKVQYPLGCWSTLIYERALVTDLKMDVSVGWVGA